MGKKKKSKNTKKTKAQAESESVIFFSPLDCSESEEDSIKHIITIESHHKPVGPHEAERHLNMQMSMAEMLKVGLYVYPVRDIHCRYYKAGCF